VIRAHNSQKNRFFCDAGKPRPSRISAPTGGLVPYRVIRRWLELQKILTIGIPTTKVKAIIIITSLSAISTLHY
jgi:hypothetical protein